MRAVALDREPLPLLSLRAWQLKSAGARSRRCGFGRISGSALEVMEPAPDAWGDFFAEAAKGGLRDSQSRDLDLERQVAE